MDILTDYANWKIEKYDLITTLNELESNIIKRYLNTINVLDYLYAKVVDNKEDLTDDEEVIFNTGFEYLDNNFITIEDILKDDFNNNIKAMEKCSKTVNLLLYIIDFEEELLNSTNDDDKLIKLDLEAFEKLENEVYDYLTKGQNVDDAMFVKLDELADKIFTKHQIEINPIDSIFYQIAETLGLLDEEEKDVFNEYVNELIDHDKTC